MKYKVKNKSSNTLVGWYKGYESCWIRPGEVLDIDELQISDCIQSWIDKGLLIVVERITNIPEDPVLTEPAQDQKTKTTKKPGNTGKNNKED